MTLAQEQSDETPPVALALALLKLKLKQATRRLTQLYKELEKPILRGDLASASFDFEVRKVPTIPTLFPPYTFKIDCNKQVLLEGRIPWKGFPREAIPLKWSRSDRALFLRVAGTPRRALTGRTLEAKPGKATSTRKRETVRATISRMRKKLQASVKVDAEAGPHYGLRTTKDGGVAIVFDVEFPRSRPTE